MHMMMRVRAAATSSLRTFIAGILLLAGCGVDVSNAFLLEPQLLALPLTAGDWKGRLGRSSSQHPLHAKTLQEVDERTIISPTVQTNNKHDRSDNDVNNSDNHPPPLFPLSLKSMLDLNNDGKVDIEDLYVITNNLKHCLDINGDGKVDAEDAKTALSVMALFTALLTSSPLPASGHGGGGHGGGGHGHGHSHRRSGTAHGSVNSDDDDMGGFERPNHTLKRSDFNPTMCWQLPEEGEEINARYEGAKDYVPNTVIEVDESKCEFKSIPLDGSTGEVPWTHTQVSNREVDTYIGFFVGVFALNRGLDSAAKRRDMELRVEVEEFNTVFDRLDIPNSGDASSSPTSGYYKGTATERGMVQTIESTLEFNKNGSIKGSGFDSMDGEYTIHGQWREAKEESTLHRQVYLVQWKEDYGDFHVVVQGVMYEKLLTVGNSTNISIKITGEFTSTREVTGTFELGQ